MKHNLRMILLVSILFCTVQITFAQEKQISGTVTSKADGLPLPGVNIIVDGTTTGAQTNFDGYYTITASVGDVLNFSFLGMTSVKQTVGTSSTIDVQLEEDAESLDEVVVTALGIKKEKKIYRQHGFAHKRH